MATRFYVPSSGAAPVDPGYAALWGTNVGSRLTLPLPRAKTGTAKLFKTILSADTVIQNVLAAVLVSEPLAAQTVAGNWTAVISTFENNAAMNASLQIVVRVVSSDGLTARGTIYGGHSAANNSTAGALGQEFTTSADNTRIIPSQAGSSVTAQTGDRLVVEMGWRAANTANIAYQAELDLGDNQASDYALTAGVVGRTSDAWVETSQNLVFTRPVIVNRLPVFNQIYSRW